MQPKSCARHRCANPSGFGHSARMDALFRRIDEIETHSRDTRDTGRTTMATRLVRRGTIHHTFGLLNIPERLMPGERYVDLPFRMLDVRNHAHNRCGRVNE